MMQPNSSRVQGLEVVQGNESAGGGGTGAGVGADGDPGTRGLGRLPVFTVPRSNASTCVTPQFTNLKRP
jgi:hypothetical protein